MKKALYLIMAVILICVLAGCNVTPNIPATTTPYTTATTAPYGNYLNRGAYGNNVTRGTYGAPYGNNLQRGTTGNGAVKPTVPGTYGSGSNINGSKGANTYTSRMNKMMNHRAYVHLNPGDSAILNPGTR